MSREAERDHEPDDEAPEHALRVVPPEQTSQAENGGKPQSEARQGASGSEHRNVIEA